MTTGTAIAGVTPATTTWADVSPPEYYPLPAYVEGAQLPTTFKVGTQYTVPLISISSVKTYLLLLGAFHGLKQRVLNAPYDHLVPPPSNAVKWLIFLCRARNRFELWVERIVKRRERATREWTTLHREEIPPLDVLLYYHAYLLNPFHLHDDSQRIFQELSVIGGFPFAAISQSINPETFDLVPTDEQVEEWEFQTQQMYDPPLVTTLDEAIVLTCPRCGNGNLSVPWLTQPPASADGSRTNGTGYAQHGFLTTCGACAAKINRDTFLVDKLARDIAHVTEARDRGVTELFPNTMFSQITEKEVFVVAETFSKLLVSSFASITSTSPNKRLTLGNLFRWDLTTAQSIIERNLRKLGPTRTWHGQILAQMMRAYRQPSPFSLDLMGAVLRQDSFVARVHALGWTSQEFLSSDSSIIVDSVESYHRFLDLAARNPRQNLVPTLHIDLSWHTHQLSGENYRLRTTEFVGRFLNHADKVEEGMLASAFEETAKKWKSAYHANYSFCGCLSNSKPGKLAFLRTLSKSSTTPDIHPALSEPSHPSEHNAVVIYEARNRLVSEGRKQREALARRTLRVGPHELAFARVVQEDIILEPSGLGDAGWDVQGLLEANILSGKETRGDCCSGATISCSSIDLTLEMPTAWSDDHIWYSISTGSTLNM